MKRSKTDFPLHLFHQGANFHTYELMGATPAIHQGAKGYVFRVWAPHAKCVSVVGSFNGWNESVHPMKRMIDNETFELFIPDLYEYDAYKFCIRTENDRILYKADPYAFHAETPTSYSTNNSKLYEFPTFAWTDSAYMDKRKHLDKYAAPLNIYEVNLLSWKLHEDGNYFTYRELAEDLVRYVSEMGYTHVEFMPLAEHPFTGSWGYQTTGYYAVTSRLGTPEDFMYLINAFHNVEIGVILDWVPAHFPKDDFGLYEFDGQPLYEASQWDRMENKGWGTRCFDYGRNEVVSFLISNAIFWLDKFHVDGLRVDAVSSMLYLDYDKGPGEWEPNIFGENKNLEAVSFLRKLNVAVARFHPDALMIAEESTAWPMITTPVDEGGLGFHYKWNMGWMNDVLSYVKLDPIYRQYAHNKLTFPLIYAFSEHYVLPVSHDEVVHGKGSLLGKMPGSYDDKFAGIRAFFGYMMSHPGKKLNFMGSEIGQFKEWNYREGMEFFLKDFPQHEKLSLMVKTLNHLYKSVPAFHEIDDSWEGFQWLQPNDNARNVIAYQRKDKFGRTIVILVNFSGVDVYDYPLGISQGEYTVIFNSDSACFGGRDTVKTAVYKTINTHSHGEEYSINVDIPKLTCVYLEKK